MTEENLTRALPSRFVLAVTVGGVVGLGILRGPGEIAEVVTKPSSYLALWLVAGLFVLLSTAVSAELVGMTPRSGGFYLCISISYRGARCPICTTVHDNAQLVHAKLTHGIVDKNSYSY